jgi:hypothetical protein
VGFDDKPVGVKVCGGFNLREAGDATAEFARLANIRRIDAEIRIPPEVIGSVQRFRVRQLNGDAIRLAHALDGFE